MISDTVFQANLKNRFLFTESQQHKIIKITDKVAKLECYKVTITTPQLIRNCMLFFKSREFIFWW